MSIPTYDQMLGPILELAAQHDITRRTAETAMVKRFDITDDEQAQRIPSGGSTYVGNRAGWAMSFLTKGKLIEKVAPKTYRAT